MGKIKTFFKAILAFVLGHKKPIIKDNTFIVWEPCTKSHSEVVPGYVKYLTDLGYNVSVLVNPKRLKEGLFARYHSPKVFINKMSKKQTYRFFKSDDLKNVKGVIVTTVGKLCDNIHFDDAYNTFASNVDRKKLLFVVHDAKQSIDAKTFKKNLIILRDLDYKGKQATVVNPHYFGDVKFTKKNKDIVNFVSVGAIRSYKQNTHLVVDTVKKLHESGYRNFKITVIGKGTLKDLPRELRRYFDVKGRLSFSKMYDEIEKADFLLTSYDVKEPKHKFYRTSGTSGAFQLVYGFGKPCLIIKDFAKINGFDDKNAIVYATNSDYFSAMEKCIKMSAKEYDAMQKSLLLSAKNLYKRSLKNLKERING